MTPIFLFIYVRVGLSLGREGQVTAIFAFIFLRDGLSLHTEFQLPILPGSRIDGFMLNPILGEGRGGDLTDDPNFSTSYFPQK